MSVQVGMVINALPSGTVLTLLEADTVTVRLAVLAPADSALVEALVRRSGLRNPRFTAAIVPVTEDGVAYDRYTIEFTPASAALSWPTQRARQ